GKSGVAGGFAGANLGSINQTYATGTAVAGDNGYAGGFAGVNLTGSITQSYATRQASGGNASIAAAFAALNVGPIDQVDAVGLVSAGENSTTGGLIALGGGSIPPLVVTRSSNALVMTTVQGTVTNSYWDRQTTGQATSAGGTGLDTASFATLPSGF